jgi:mRNA-degrading endonuclease RelE of RelBE toxin-antitoxin system
MNYKIIPSEEFKKKTKILQKKYRNIKQDIELLVKELLDNPFMGIELGNNTYKIRIKNSDNNKGKSAGYRVITYVVDKENKIFLVSIYSKSKHENILDNELKELIEDLNKNSKEL